MNILFITNHLNIGGVTTYVLALAMGLKKRGHNVFIASSGGEMLPKFAEAGIVFIPIPIKTKKEIGPKILACKFKLNKFLRQQKIDLFHTHSRTTQVLGSLVSRSKGIPHITTWHGYFKRRFLRRIFPCWPEKIIAISDQVKEHLIKDFKVEEKYIAVINNGIDVNKYAIPTTDDGIRKRNELGLSGASVIGIVSRLSDVKGHKYLIGAIKEVLGKIPSAQLLIVGEGKEKKRLTALVNNLGITKSVFFLPSVTDTRGVLCAMDIFVLPSLKEGLGLALMEAMASGLAVIGSDIGGIRSLIKDRVNGLLVKPADSQALAAAILELLQDPAKRASYAKQAQEFIRQNFSLDKMVEETEKVYAEFVHES